MPVAGLLAIATVLFALPAPAPGSETLWSLLRSGGQVVLLRHALTTPGVGDPAGFRLDDCATQRNLSETGRRDARRIGSGRFRVAGRLAADAVE
jgi:hypothetical protein